MDSLNAYMTVDKFWELLSKKISSEASEAELAEFEEILISHPDWKNTAETLSLLWQQSHPFVNHEAEQSFKRHLERMKKAGAGFNELNQPDNLEIGSEERSAKQNRKKWWIPIAGVVAAALVFFILKNNIVASATKTDNNSPISQVITKPGSKTQIQLPDGSTVWLNSSSKLTYDENFGKTLREVNLTGEAFFDVVKDPSHPFIIHTSVIDVKVLGTQFNVRSYPEDVNTETSLLKGSVEITIKNRQNEKHYLKPNEKIVVANNIVPDVTADKKKRSEALITLKPLTYYPVDSTIIETSWVDNKLIFQENETFREVALKMERRYGVNISFEDEKVANIRPFGSFRNETITQALDAMRESLRFNYKKHGDDIIITQ